MEDKTPTIKYSDSPYAPDWAKAPEKRQKKPQDAASVPSIQEDETFQPTVEQIEAIIWANADEDNRVYCIMDGYWARGLYSRLMGSQDLSWAHIFQGDVATRNIQQAPFIVALKRGHPFMRWLIEDGWGKGWGIFFVASTRRTTLHYGTPYIHDKRFLPSNEEQLKLGNLIEGEEDSLWKIRRHFRKFSDAQFEGENRIVNFRYYDPGAFDAYVHSCDGNGIMEFLGPVSHVYYREAVYTPLEPTLSLLSMLSILPSREIHLTQIDLTNGSRTLQEKAIASPSGTRRAKTAYPWPISQKQQEVFQAKEWNKLVRQITAELSFSYIHPNVFPSYQKLLRYVQESMGIANKLNIQIQYDIRNFVKCRLHYGENFYKESVTMSRHFADSNRNPAELDALLAHWANAI